MGVVLSVADGTSIINESIWESRFQYTAELNKMGANITAQGKSAVFEGEKNKERKRFNIKVKREKDFTKLCNSYAHRVTRWCVYNSVLKV